MSRPICREDLFDYHVEQVLRLLHQTWKDHETTQNFEDWLEDNPKEVGNAFLADLEQWSGVKEALQSLE